MTTTTLHAANDVLRSAVKARLDATPADDPKLVGYKPPILSGCKPAEECAADVLSRAASCCDGQRMRGDSLLKSDVHPTSQAYFDLLDQMKALHASKSRDYGSEHDPLANIRNGALFVGIEPWKGAMVRLSDKVTRLATFNRTGTLTHEGVEDNLMDLASYALLALLLYREENGK
jgi:hypothetical protein